MHLVFNENILNCFPCHMIILVRERTINEPNEKSNPFCHQNRMITPCEAKTHLWQFGLGQGQNYLVFVHCLNGAWGRCKYRLCLWAKGVLTRSQKLFNLIRKTTKTYSLFLNDWHGNLRRQTFMNWLLLARFFSPIVTIIWEPSSLRVLKLPIKKNTTQNTHYTFS